MSDWGPYKGVRDFYPEDQRVQNFLFKTMRTTVERYGFEEMNASVLEPTELYTLKSNEEMVREETYTFEDRGGRSVTLRPEMTPTVARMVATRKRELGYPLRLYSIQNFFRYDRQQRGRLREFWQLNADIFGVPGIEADLEIIALANALLVAYGATEKMYVFRVGSRVALQTVFEKIGLSADAQKSLRILLDKKAKMSPEDFEAARREITPEPVETMLEEDASARECMALLEKSGIPALYDPSVVRGFEYYTNIVFEAFDSDPTNARSLLGGGRYDALVGMYGAEDVPAVGFAIGDVVLRDFLETHALLPSLLPTTELYLAPLDEIDGAHRTVENLRKQGVCVAVGMKHTKIADHIRNAEKLGIPFFTAYGETEHASGALLLKNLAIGTENRVRIDSVSTFLKNA